jgi:hypothetical protein
MERNFLNKIKVVTTVASWPEALQLQKLSLSKYMLEPFELIGVIDTPKDPGPYNLWDPNLRNKAIAIAESVCERIIVVPEEVHKNRATIFSETKELSGTNANLRASDSLQFAFNLEILNSGSRVLILDNDMFPIAQFSWDEKMYEKFCRSVIHTSSSRYRKRSVSYLWSGLMFIDSAQIPFKEIWSFDCGKINGVKVDVSGHTYYWYEKIKQNGLVKRFEPINHYPSLQWGEANLTSVFSKAISKYIIEDQRNVNNQYYTEFYDQTFLHFRAGSNWNKEPALTVENRIKKFTDSFKQHVYETAR